MKRRHLLSEEGLNEIRLGTDLSRDGSPDSDIFERNTNMMPLNVIHLEDDPLDAELTMAKLEEGGFNCRSVRVETRLDFLDTLENEDADIILADYSLPAFDGLSALKISMSLRPETPFILLSGALGEDLAIESMKSGATDYVLKQRLDRLIPAVQRALREADTRKDRRTAEAKLILSEERFRLAMEALKGIVYEVNTVTDTIYRSEGMFPVIGYHPEEAGANLAWWYDRIHPDDVQQATDEMMRAGSGEKFYEVEYRVRHRDGSYRNVGDKGRVLSDERGRQLRIIGVIVDITQQKQAQAAIENLNARLRRAMAESHHRIKNNLQVLAAIVEMQRLRYDLTVPISALDKLSLHIRSLSSLHDLLTHEAKQGGAFDHVSLKNTLGEIVALIRNTAGSREITWESDEVFLPVKQSGSFTLLATELISNALKHGEGMIEVSLKLKAGFGHLAVIDSGAGFPEGFLPETNASIGMDLIESLVRWDLHGVAKYANGRNGGACVEIVFPIPETVNSDCDTSLPLDRFPIEDIMA